MNKNVIGILLESIIIKNNINVLEIILKIITSKGGGKLNNINHQ